MPDAASIDSAPLPLAYEAWRASELGRITDRIEEELILRLIGPVQGKSVLDVGCGDGGLAVRLALLGASVAAVDADPRMLAAARARAAIAQVGVVHVAADARALPFADDTFDVVTAVTVLCFVADAAPALKELARVLRPGGRLVLGELGRLSLFAARRRLAGWLGATTWRLASFRTPAELRRLAAVAGLDVTELRGAIYYPPCDLCARWMARLDHHFGALTTAGAAFIALASSKPDRASERVRA